MKQILICLFISFYNATASSSPQDSDYQTRQKADSLFLEALRLKETGKYSEAFDSMYNAFLIDSTSSAVLYELSKFYLSQGKSYLAINALQKAVKYSPDTKEYKILLAESNRDLDNIDESVALYEELSAAFPDKNEFWLNLTELYIKQKNADKASDAINALENNIGTNALLYVYMLMTGDLFIEKEDYDKALDILLQGLKHIPPENNTTFSAVYGQIGNIYYQKGEKVKAYEYFDKALEYDGNNIFVLNNYAYFLTADRKDLDRAERMSGRCVGAQPTNSTYLDTYAWVFFCKEQYFKAKLYVENAISNGGDKNSDILDHYGDILFMLGNTALAVSQWEKALALKQKNNETDTEILKHKITNKTYYETPAE
ncbi:MAG: tetratricopeptide repeat protein [Dysgonamonadaceae bacterium]|jgi:tetratricopeptide (TPR) repeat protein|nr:tetratricopeptide repeat protein [Dysgonamonadaceae bacterium]